jgi:antirestriction protein ArdC
MSAVWPAIRASETWLPYGYRAELGSAFLCADLGLTPEPRPDHASYIESWLRVLKNDKRAIFTAAAHADRAASFLHGLQPEATATAAANDDDEREAAA